MVKHVTSNCATGSHPGSVLGTHVRMTEASGAERRKGARASDEPNPEPPLPLVLCYEGLKVPLFPKTMTCAPTHG